MSGFQLDRRPTDSGRFAVQQTWSPTAPARFDGRRLAVAANGACVPKLALAPKEAFCRVDMPGAIACVAEWGGVRAQLLTMDRAATCEWEFRLPSLVIMTQPEGGTTGCEWTDGSEMRKMAALPPCSVLFNPADHYLRVRRRLRSKARMLLVIIDPADLNRLIDDLAPAELYFQQRVDLTDAFLHRILQAIAQEIEMTGPGGGVYRNSLILLLGAQLVRCASNLAHSPKPAYAKGGLPTWRLRRALEILHARVMDRPSLTDLASHVGLHPTYFCRAFKRSMGVSPHRYLLERRIARAKEMMTDHTMTLTQIALDCGFGTSSQLSVIFRRLTGVSPTPTDDRSRPRR
jgi:AraC family transcriptional regulator